MATYSYETFQTDTINEFLNSPDAKVLSLPFESDKKVDMDRVKQILDKKFTNYSDIEIIKDVFSTTLLHQSDEYKNGTPHLKSSITDVFKNIKLATSEESAQGYALLSGFYNKDDMFIIKTTRSDGDKESNNNTLYEYFIGTYGLNPLREFIPNFCYTFGAFKCNPVSLTGKTVKKMCNIRGDINYVIYERVPGKTITDIIKKGEANSKLISYIIQICLALQVAYEKVGYVHYDLHPGNVIIRKLEKPTEIDYDIGGMTYSVKTDAVATIIDYGFSHFTYRGMQFGGADISDYSINPVTAPSGYDMFKLLGFILHDLYKKHGSDKNYDNFINHFKNIYSYYSNDKYGIIEGWDNKDKLNYRFSKGKDNFFALSKYDPYYYKQPIDLITWLSKNYTGLFNQFVTVYDRDKYTDNNFVDKYRNLLEREKIFGTPAKLPINDISRNYKSKILNSESTDNIYNLLDEFGSTLSDSEKQEIDKIKNNLLSNEDEYVQNDKDMFNRWDDSLSKYKWDSDCDKLNNILDEIKSLYRLRCFLPLVNRINSYCKQYQKYARMVYFSGGNTLEINEDYKKLYYRFRNLYKKYYTAYSQEIYSTIYKHKTIDDKDELSDYQYAIGNILKLNNLYFQAVRYKIMLFVMRSMIKTGNLEYIHPCIGYAACAIYHKRTIDVVKTDIRDTLVKYITGEGVKDIVNGTTNYTSDISIYRDCDKYRKSVIDDTGIRGSVIHYIDNIFGEIEISNRSCLLDIDGETDHLASIIGKKFSLDKGNTVCTGSVTIKNDNVTYMEWLDFKDIPDKKYNIITLFNGFQSITSDGVRDFLLENIRNLLTPDGYLVIRENDCDKGYKMIICDMDKILNHRYKYGVTREENKRYMDTLSCKYSTKKDMEFRELRLVKEITENTNNPTGVYYRIYKNQK